MTNENTKDNDAFLVYLEDCIGEVNDITAPELLNCIIQTYKGITYGSNES